MTTLRDLEVKNTRDAEAIAGYKKQIAQLAACIQDREGRIRRRLPIIERVNKQEVSEFELALLRAKQRGVLRGDQTYHHRDGQTQVTHVNGKYILSVNGIPTFASPNLELLSETFFMDYPEAKIFLSADDT